MGAGAITACLCAGLVAWGAAPAAMAATGPALTLSTSSVPFGNVLVQKAVTRTVTLKSSGATALTINSGTLSGAPAFTMSGVAFPITLNPGQSATLTIQCDPGAAGAKTGTIALTTNTSSGKATIALTATAVVVPGLTLSPASVAFGDVDVNTPKTEKVALKSSGTTALIIKSGTLSGAPAFTMSGVAFPITLNPGQSATLTIQCDPGAAGAKTGTIALTTNTSSGKATIALTATAVVVPGLTLSPASVAFGDVDVNTPKTEKVALKSSGTTALIIKSGTLSGAPAFTMSGVAFPITLNPGQSATLTIQCDPGAAGAKTGTIALTTNTSSGKATIALTATAVVVPGLTLSPASVAFGDVDVNTPKTEKVALKSSGTTALIIKSGTLSGAPAFTMSGVAFPITLNPGQSATLTIQCDPGAAGAKTGTIALTTNTSSGKATIALTATAVVVPGLTLSPASVAFGDVDVNTPKTETVALKSSGTGPLTLKTGAVSGAGFSISGIKFPLTLDPGQSAALTIQCDPGAAGAKTGTVTLTTNTSSGKATISLNATAVAVPGLTLSASSVSFGEVALKTPVNKAVTLKSTGDAALTISAGTMGGATAFSISGVSFPVTLNEGQSVTLTIRCDATTAGALAGTIKLKTNAPSGSSTISLSATGESGTTPALTLGSTSVSFGDVGLNTPATQSVTLTSSGSAAVTISGATATGTGFSIVGPSFPVTLNPGQAASLEIEFDPKTAGGETGTATVTTNVSGGTPTLSLSGTGEDATTTQVDLNWQAPSNPADPATGYDIYRAPKGSTDFQLLNSSPESATSYADTTAVAGATYSYYVASVDANENVSGPSNVFTVTVPQ